VLGPNETKEERSMLKNRRTALRLAAVAAVVTGTMSLGVGAAHADPGIDLGSLFGGSSSLGGDNGPDNNPIANGDKGNALDGVTDLVQQILPGESADGGPLINLAPINIEVPGLVDVAGSVEVLDPDALAEVPCLGVGLFSESASCPEATPTVDEQTGDLIDIPVNLTEVPIVGDVTGDVNVDRNLDTDVCLNAELLGDVTGGLLNAVKSGIGQQDCLGSNGPVGPQGPPEGPAGPQGNGTPSDNGDSLPFTGAEGMLALSGLGAAMFAGGHVIRRFATKR
jgi:hypothetical protein